MYVLPPLLYVPRDYVLAMDLDRLLPEVRQIRRVTLTCASVQYSIVTFLTLPVLTNTVWCFRNE
jgi:hypothetical protein